MNVSRQTLNTPIGPLAIHEAGTGPALVFWHSMFVDHRMFSRQVEAFSGTHRCVAIDGPGHGASVGPRRGITLDDCALGVIAILDAMNIDSAHFVGCGWGGHVGVCLASSAPRRVLSLVAANTPMQPVTSRERRRVTALSCVYRVLGPRQFLRRAVEEGLLAASHRAEFGPYVRECFTEARVKGLYDAMRCFILDRPSIEGRLSAITAPALFIAGTEDAVWAVETARQQAATARARLELVTDTGHLTPLESSEAVNGLLRDFWSEVET